MKRIYVIVLMLISANILNAQVAISTDCSDPLPTSILEIKSTSRGLLIPRMTSTEMGNISNPATGLAVFSYSGSNDGQFYYYNGTAWVTFGTEDGDAWDVEGEDQVSAIGRMGRVGIGTTTPVAASMLEVAGHIWVTSTGNSVFLGEDAGEDDDLTNNSNLCIGYAAAQHNVSSESIIAIGSYALQNVTGDENTVIGSGSMNGSVSGTKNTVIGCGAMWDSESGSENVAIGYSSMSNNLTGSNNTAIGTYSLTGNNGNNNTGLGYQVLQSNNSGSNNAAYGREAGSSITSGSNNCLAGYRAGDNITSGSNNIIIGYDLDAPSATADNQMYIGGVIYGNLANGNIGINNTNPGERLDIDGVLRLRETATPTAHAGDIYFDGDHFMLYNGTDWVQIDNCL
jgi:hypothetical protein